MFNPYYWFIAHSYHTNLEYARKQKGALYPIDESEIHDKSILIGFIVLILPSIIVYRYTYIFIGSPKLSIELRYLLAFFMVVLISIFNYFYLKRKGMIEKIANKYKYDHAMKEFKYFHFLYYLAYIGICVSITAMPDYISF